MNNKQIQYLLTLMKGEVSQADSKIGWRITYLGIILGALVALVIAFQDSWYYTVPFIVYISLKLLILLNGLRPILKTRILLASKKNNGNIYYFGDISKMSDEDFHKRLGIKKPSKEDLYLLNQVKANAEIADRKYESFKWSFPILSLIRKIVA